MSIDEERAPIIPALFRLGFGIPGKFLENSWKIPGKFLENSWMGPRDGTQPSSFARWKIPGKFKVEV
jgi:hypothetical protein